MNLSALSSNASATIVKDKQSALGLPDDPETTSSAAESSALTEDGKQAEAQSDTVQLSDKAKAIVRSLQARDQEVHAHEQAHLAAAGGLATGGASYTYQKGPDGVDYAIGGEVSIDVSAGRTPEETIARAATIRAAALAPSDPSGQDRSVAAAASQLEQQARAELMMAAAAEVQAKLQANAAGAYRDTAVMANQNLGANIDAVA
jgi:hypothetical protein